MDSNEFISELYSILPFKIEDANLDIKYLRKLVKSINLYKYKKLKERYAEHYPRNIVVDQSIIKNNKTIRVRLIDQYDYKCLSRIVNAKLKLKSEQIEDIRNVRDISKQIIIDNLKLKSDYKLSKNIIPNDHKIDSLLDELDLTKKVKYSNTYYKSDYNMYLLSNIPHEQSAIVIYTIGRIIYNLNINDNMSDDTNKHKINMFSQWSKLSDEKIDELWFIYKNSNKKLYDQNLLFIIASLYTNVLYNYNRENCIYIIENQDTTKCEINYTLDSVENIYKIYSEIYNPNIKVLIYETDDNEILYNKLKHHFRFDNIIGNIYESSQINNYKLFLNKHI